MLPHSVSCLLSSVFHVSVTGTILRETRKIDLLQMGTAFKFKWFCEVDRKAGLFASFLARFIALDQLGGSLRSEKSLSIGLN